MNMMYKMRIKYARTSLFHLQFGILQEPTSEDPDCKFAHAKPGNGLKTHSFLPLYSYVSQISATSARFRGVDKFVFSMLISQKRETVT
jgi:hypothetical protein